MSVFILVKTTSHTNNGIKRHSCIFCIHSIVLFRFFFLFLQKHSKYTKWYWKVKGGKKIWIKLNAGHHSKKNKKIMPTEYHFGLCYKCVMWHLIFQCQWYQCECVVKWDRKKRHLIRRMKTFTKCVMLNKLMNHCSTYFIFHPCQTDNLSHTTSFFLIMFVYNKSKQWTSKITQKEIFFYPFQFFFSFFLPSYYVK